MQPYRLLKQFIPTGQDGDPWWARRRIYIQFSGSYANFNVIDDKNVTTIVPTDAQTGLITVTNNVGVDDSKDPFVVT